MKGGNDHDENVILDHDHGGMSTGNTNISSSNYSTEDSSNSSDSTMLAPKVMISKSKLMRTIRRMERMDKLTKLGKMERKKAKKHATTNQNRSDCSTISYSYDDQSSRSSNSSVPVTRNKKDKG